MELWLSIKRATITSFFLVWLLSLFVSITNLAIPLYTLQIFDRVLPSKSSQTLFMLLGAILILGILFIGSEKIRRQVTNFLAHQVGTLIEPLILKKQVNDVQRSSDQGYKSLKNLKALQHFICSPTLLAAMDLSLSPLLIIALFFLHPYFGYSILFCNFLLLTLLIFQQHSLNKTDYEYQRFQEKQWGNQQSLINNIDSIRCMGMSQGWLHTHQELNSTVYQKQFTHQKSNHNFQVLAIVIRWICQITIPTIGAFLLIHQQISVGVMLAALMISMRCIIPFETIINSWQLLIKVKKIFSELTIFFNLEPNIALVEPLTELKGYIEVKSLKVNNISLNKTILSIDSFHAKPGSFTAIIGQNGAGKSLFLQTLIKNISHVSGEILYDGINVTTVQQQWLGKQIGYIPQKLCLPKASIKEIVSHHEECNDSKVISATQLAGVHQTILTMDQGYDSIISSQSGQLPPGILQRIALARALYHQPKILILDEADAYLDNQGKDNFIKLITQQIRKGTTVIAATQNQPLLSSASHVLLIEKGKSEFSGEISAFQDFIRELAEKRKVSNLFSS